MKQPGKIHYAKFADSDRLQRFLDLLLDGQRHTTLEIIHSADICAVNSAACELRENGFEVECDHKRPASYWLTDVDDARLLKAELLAERRAA
jgi:hypothetical protein